MYPVYVFVSFRNLYTGGDEKQEINLIWLYLMIALTEVPSSTHELVC